MPPDNYENFVGGYYEQKGGVMYLYTITGALVTTIKLPTEFITGCLNCDSTGLVGAGRTLEGFIKHFPCFCQIGASPN